MSASLDYAPDGLPVVRRASIRRRVAYLGCLVLTLAYVSGPIIAGANAFGDRRGPVIYPEEMHRFFYALAWEAAGHPGKPRVGLNAPPRPWFYGL